MCCGGGGGGAEQNSDKHMEQLAQPLRKTLRYSLQVYGEVYTLWVCTVSVHESRGDKEKEVSSSGSIKNALSDSALLSYLLWVHRSRAEVTTLQHLIIISN